MTQILSDWEFRLKCAEYERAKRVRLGNRLERMASEMRAKYLTPRRKAAIETWKRRKSSALSDTVKLLSEGSVKL